MAKFKPRRTSQSVVLFAVCVGSAVLGFTLGGNRVATAGSYRPPLLRQSDDKMIERRVFSNEPFEFTDLAVKNVRIAESELATYWAASIRRYKFSAKSMTESGGGDIGDWLENLEFSIRNTSRKQITYFLLELDFPETSASGAMMVYTLPKGIHPRSLAETKRPREPLALYPGDTFTFTLSAIELKQIKSFLALQTFELASLNKVGIRIGTITFDNGIMWEQGDYYRPNPIAPGGYERINQQ